MELYEDIYFAQGEDASEDLEAIEQEGPEAFAQALIEMIYDEGSHPRRHTPPWGGEDTLYHLEGGFVLAVNWRFGTVGLARIVRGSGDAP